MHVAPERRVREGIQGILGWLRMTVVILRTWASAKVANDQRHRRSSLASFRYLWRAGGVFERLD